MRIIETPMFVLNRFHPEDNSLCESIIINEYTLRAFQADVANDKVSNNVTVVDMDGTTARIQPNGLLTCKLPGMGTASNLISELYNAMR